ncbi:unnamed protein product [Calypogeia fissa]
MVSCHQYPYRPRVGPRLFTVTSFLILMDKLIQSKKDVELLRKDDIIINCLGSNGEMCHMWNSLCKGFSIYPNPQWVDMLNCLTLRYKNRKYQLYAEFRAEYFKRPWVVASWGAGVVLLVVTALQTIYTVVSYYLPPTPQ